MCEDIGDLAEEIIDDITPVAVHVYNDSAAIFATVIPAWALGRLIFIMTSEDPVSKFAAHRKDLTKEAGLLQLLEGLNSRKPKLVLDRAVFHSGSLCNLRDAIRFRRKNRRGLLAINVLSRSDGPLKKTNPVGSPRSVEKNLIRVICEHPIKIGGVFLYSMFLRQRLKLFLIAAGQNGIRHQDRAILQSHPALLANREDRAHEVLIGSHASGDAVHDNSYRFSAHVVR